MLPFSLVPGPATLLVWPLGCIPALPTQRRPRAFGGFSLTSCFSRSAPDHTGDVYSTLIGRDTTTDLAVLRVSSVALAPLVWAEPDLASLRVGHLVSAMERPGQRAQATLGIVSAFGESWRTPTGGLLDRYVRTDVVMFSGFSGGPLVNAAGHVITSRSASAIGA